MRFVGFEVDGEFCHHLHVRTTLSRSSLDRYTNLRRWRIDLATFCFCWRIGELVRATEFRLMSILTSRIFDNHQISSWMHRPVARVGHGAKVAFKCVWQWRCRAFLAALHFVLLALSAAVDVVAFFRLALLRLDFLHRLLAWRWFSSLVPGWLTGWRLFLELSFSCNLDDLLLAAFSILREFLICERNLRLEMIAQNIRLWLSPFFAASPFIAFSCSRAFSLTWWNSLSGISWAHFCFKIPKYDEASTCRSWRLFFSSSRTFSTRFWMTCSVRKRIGKWFWMCMRMTKALRIWM